ncbi:MAG: hypothetical protein IKF18_00670 [Erysipelotrichaceae bacterium]|nr:hypothetical protein [Erysipelotrichaceae bacterium]
MKPSEFRKFYLTFVELYGAIGSDDAFAIMKRFFPKLLKKEMYADMKSRTGKKTRGYCILPTDGRRFAVCEENSDEEDLAHIFFDHRDLPFYVPDDLQEYWDIGANGLPLSSAGEKLIDYLQSECGADSDHATARTLIIEYIILNADYVDIPDRILRYIEIWEPAIDDAEKLQTVLDLILEMTRTTRLPSCCGHTLNELDEMGVDNIEEHLFGIADTLYDLMLKEGLSEEEMVRQIREDSSLPEYARDLLIGRLKELAEEKKNVAEA